VIEGIGRRPAASRHSAGELAYRKARERPAEAAAINGFGIVRGGAHNSRARVSLG